MPLAALVCLAALAPQAEWVSLFDGKTLDGWTPKIKGHELGDNFGNTFRVKDGVIQVGYEAYDEFGDRFGHLFYKTPYSSYIFHVEYRFTGEQCKNGPSWAWRNSGAMIHCQDPKTMGLDQDFPVSAEVQMLGGDKEGERPTGNLCTPGTNVVMGDKLITQHCTDSTSPTFRGDVWVTLDVEVHGNGRVEHRINGKPVISYEQIQLDPNDKDGAKLIKDGKVSLSSGWISLQSESHPVEFRDIKIKVLND
jgi:hypothetical protein